MYKKSDRFNDYIHLLRRTLGTAFYSYNEIPEIILLPYRDAGFGVCLTLKGQSHPIWDYILGFRKLSAFLRITNGL
jgi:hypothetical protein